MAPATNNIVEVISKEMIKPSSPTPPHLRTIKRSYLDAIINPMYNSLVFFYQKPDHDHHVTITSQCLKQSLSHTLTLFYPLAGRIQDNHIVDCNDSGAVFIEARVHAQLKDSIQDPDMEDLKQYLPLTAVHAGLFLVQINSFDCGGIAVGVCFSHQIADFTSIMSFIMAWAGATTNCGPDVRRISPSFDLAKYFPSRDSLNSWEVAPSIMSDETFTTKRFVFDKVKLSALQELAAVDKQLVAPTRVELISAFIWESFMHAESNKYNVFAAYHAVNLRPRKSPPQLLENVFGNCFIPAYTFFDSTDEFLDVVRKLRNTIRKIDDGYVTELQRGSAYLNDFDKALSSTGKGEMGWGGFASWCWFPVYEVDFGWGKPVWFCTTALPLKNATVFVRSRCGEEIEAWVNMEQHNLDFLCAKFKLI